MKLISILILCVMATVVTLSCEADKVTPPRYIPTDDILKNKDDVLHNLELSYDERNVDEYNQLLDDNFTMIFSDADVAAGKAPVQWERAKEVEVATKILNNTESDPALQVKSIYLNLDWVAGDWTEEKENQNHPGESWYLKIVEYDLVVDFEDGWQRRGFDLKAAITIRWDEDLEHWRIVLWVDDVTVSLALTPARGAVEESTWGGIKARYQ